MRTLEIPKITLRGFYKLLPFLVFILAWISAFHAPYQFDDYITPLQDPASQSLVEWWKQLFFTLRPLTKLTYAIESSLGLVEAYQRRIFQYFLAICSSYLLANFLEKKYSNRFFSFLLASIWIVLPIHAETFIAISGRPTLLAIFFILLSLLSPKPYLKMVFAILAMLSKETAVLFFLFQLFFIRKKTVVTILMVLLLIPLLVRDHFLKLIQYSWSEVPFIIPWWEGPAGISAGLTTMLRPFSVSLEMDFPWMVSALWFFVSCILVFIVLIQIFKKRKTSPLLSWSLGFWLLMILPTQSFIPKLDPLSLRSISFSSLAYPFVCMAIWGKSSKINQKIYYFFAGLLVIYLFSSYLLANKYNNPVYLWQDASSKAERKARPLVNLSYFLMREGKISEARDALMLAKKRAPFDQEIDQRLKAIETVKETEQLLNEGSSHER